MRVFKSIVLLLSICSILSCSSDDSEGAISKEENISSALFSGTINNENFMATNGVGYIQQFEQGDMLAVEIAANEFECYDDIFNAFDHISVSIPIDVEGIQTLNVVTKIIGASFGPSNDLEGKAELVSISETEAIIRIKTASDFLDSKYDLEGQFTVTICSNI